MNKIPTQFENKTGLHQRYQIKKLLPVEYPLSIVNGEPSLVEKFITLEDCDEGSEYFVMRLDEGGKDLEHIKACRIGVHAYANAIEHHLPELAKDLRERYPLIARAALSSEPGGEDELKERYEKGGKDAIESLREVLTNGMEHFPEVVKRIYTVLIEDLKTFPLAPYKPKP